LKQSQKTILLWLFLILMFVGIYKLFTGDGTKEEELDVAWLKAELSNTEKVATLDKVEIQPKGRDDAKYVLSYKSGGNKKVVHGPYSGAGNDITEALDKGQIPWTVRSKEESAFWQTLIVSWLPMLFLFVIFFFFMRQLQAGGGKAMSFGKSKAKLLTDHQNKITFKDVAGVE
jgi:cell division protease FtsH